ncbi:MAG: pirin family protein [Marmoricola sp.]
MPIDVRGPADRFVTRAEGRTTWHSFSFGMHYDPHNVGFGALVAHNDELLPPGTGYPEHPHVDIEIITWVLSGVLRHTDSTGRTGVVVPGQVQRLSAGSGVVHTEISDAIGPTRFLQAWVRPDEPDLVPSYAADVVGPTHNTWVPLAGPDGVPVHARAAALHLGLLDREVRLELPDAPRLHVFVATGGLTIGEDQLRTGAAARLVDEGGRPATATEPDTQVLVWSLP